MAKRSPMTFETVCQMACAFPGVQVGTSYGTPALRVNGKLLARLREDGETLVVKIDDQQREFRMMTAPDVFFITDHYRGYSAVLVRLARVDPGDMADIIEESWRWLAPRKLVAEYEKTHPSQPVAFSPGEEG